MSWQVFTLTFWSVLLAELADKTQIVGIGMSAKTGKPWVVLLGSVAAYIVVTSASVLVGSIISNYIKPEIIRYAGACIFILIGLLIICKVI